VENFWQGGLQIFALIQKHQTLSLVKVRELPIKLLDVNIFSSAENLVFYGASIDYRLKVFSMSDVENGSVDEIPGFESFQSKVYVRNAGPIFTLEGRDYRPFQDCQDRYGMRVGVWEVPNKFEPFPSRLLEHFASLAQLETSGAMLSAATGPPWISLSRESWTSSKYHHLTVTTLIPGSPGRGLLDGGLDFLFDTHGTSKVRH